MIIFNIIHNYDNIINRFGIKADYITNDNAITINKQNKVFSVIHCYDIYISRFGLPILGISMDDVNRILHRYK